MRKIEQMMVGAVVVHQNWKSGNTRVEICQKDGADRYAKVSLHENLISIVDYVRMTVTLYTGGWYSNTTKSRALIRLLHNALSRYFVVIY